MAAYVTPMISCIKNKNWRWHEVSHLLADTVDELHLFAKKLGLKREWYQHKSAPHYDLTERKFNKAIKLGAKLFTKDEFLAHTDKHRIYGA